jgi:hypothetical protein
VEKVRVLYTPHTLRGREWLRRCTSHSRRTSVRPPPPPKAPPPQPFNPGCWLCTQWLPVYLCCRGLGGTGGRWRGGFCDSGLTSYAEHITGPSQAVPRCPTSARSQQNSLILREKKKWINIETASHGRCGRDLRTGQPRLNVTCCSCLFCFFDYKEVNELNSSLPPSLHSCWLSPLLSSRDVPIKKCLPDTDYNPHPVVPEDHRIGGISDAGIINGTNLHRSAPCNEV